MPWYSILPAHLTSYETWMVRAFLILAILNIAPWILAFLYDLLYYVARQIWYHTPVIGGRAQGAQRPRAPSLRDRARRTSFLELVTGGNGRDKDGDHGSPTGNGRAGEERRHRRNLSREGIAEEIEGEVEQVREKT